MELTERQKQLKTNILNPEVRDGVSVSAELKKIWKVELEILEQFIDVCERHNLRWFALAGTLIGAARHKGFVPWDDDIDVAMPRSDYEQFIKFAQKELKYPYELSNSAINPAHWHQGITRICNSETAAIPCEYVHEKRLFNMGIFMDIVPVDGAPDSDRILHWQGKLVGYMRAISRYRFVAPDVDDSLGRLKAIVSKFIYFVLRNRGLEFIKRTVTTWYKFGETERSGCVGINFLKRDIFPSRLWMRTIKLPFEYLEVNAPADYDEFLTVRYGNWRKFQPQEVYHSYDFYPDISYKQVLCEKYGYPAQD